MRHVYSFPEIQKKLNFSQQNPKVTAFWDRHPAQVLETKSRAQFSALRTHCFWIWVPNNTLNGPIIKDMTIEKIYFKKILWFLPRIRRKVID